MNLQIFRRAVLVLLCVLLAACAVPPKPRPVPPASAVPFITPMQLVSPLTTATHFVSPLATARVASPFLTPTAMPSSTATPTPAEPPTALIVPVTPTPLQATFTPTRAPTLPSPAVVPGATATRVPALPSPTFIPGPTSTRAPTLTPAPTVSPILVTAWVSNPAPQPGVDVSVYGRLLVNGRPVSGEGMVARWHFKGGRIVDCVADTWVDGVAYCTENTYGEPAGFTVRIEVFIKYNQVPYRATAELTIDD
jgi:hypothetical protein